MQTSSEGRDDRGSRAGRRGRQRRRRNIALGVLGVALFGSLIPIWGRLYSFDPDLGRLSPEEHPWYFPVLMVHVVGSSLGVVTCFLQVWPWLRRRYPRVHRVCGRIYVFAGIYPATISVLVISAFWPFSPISVSSDILSSVLWLGLTHYGWVLARQRRYADHRRWMLRSFALTASNLLTQVIGIPIGMILKPMLHTRFEGSEDILQQVWVGIDVWLAWTIAFIAVEWWLEREQLRRSARRRVPGGKREPSSAQQGEPSAVAQGEPTPVG